MVVGFGGLQPNSDLALPLFPVRRASSLWHKRVHDTVLPALYPDPIAVGSPYRFFFPGVGLVEPLLHLAWHSRVCDWRNVDRGGYSPAAGGVSRDLFSGFI